MQQTFGLKRFVVEHSKVALVMAAGVLAMMVAGMVAVNIATHSTAVGSGQRAAIADVSARPRQLPHPSDRPAAQLGISSLAPTPLRQDAAPAPTASMPGELTPAQLLSKYRQYNPTVDGPGSSALGRLLRDYARYNPTMDTVPAPTASAPLRQWLAYPHHIGFTD